MESIDAPPLRPWCLFKSGSEPFAVDLESVAEVVESDRLVRLSHCPPLVLGLCAVRRDIVPVLDLTPRAIDDEAGLQAKVVVLILKTEQGTWGIRIDREGTAVAEGDLEADDGRGDATPDGPVLIGSLVREGTSHAVIDPGRTWRGVREQIERSYRV